MTYVITYDQIPESEQADVFETLEQVKQFACQYLNGSYNMNMSYENLANTLTQNGYYLNLT